MTCLTGDHAREKREKNEMLIKGPLKRIIKTLVMSFAGFNGLKEFQGIGRLSIDFIDVSRVFLVVLLT